MYTHWGMETHLKEASKISQFTPFKPLSAINKKKLCKTYCIVKYLKIAKMQLSKGLRKFLNFFSHIYIYI